MTTTAVIKHFNVLEQVRNSFAVRAIPRAVYPLVLQAVEEAFRRRVPAIAFATHRAAHPVRGQRALEFMARVLTASIGSVRISVFKAGLRFTRMAERIDPRKG